VLINQKADATSLTRPRLGLLGVGFSIISRCRSGRSRGELDGEGGWGDGRNVKDHGPNRQWGEKETYFWRLGSKMILVDWPSAVLSDTWGPEITSSVEPSMRKNLQDPSKRRTP
jgi:hypothetical protein